MGDYNRVGIGVVIDGSGIWATFDFANAPGTLPPPPLRRPRIGASPAPAAARSR